MWQCFPWHIGFARLERIAQALRRLRKCLQIVHDRICAMRERKNASLPSLVYVRIKSMHSRMCASKTRSFPSPMSQWLRLPQYPVAHLGMQRKFRDHIHPAVEQFLNVRKQGRQVQPRLPRME